jgi:probable HAF family extracellular repeat protein
MMFSKTQALRRRVPVIAVALVVIALSTACDDEKSSTTSAGSSETIQQHGFLLEGDDLTTFEPPAVSILRVGEPEPFELVDINNKGQMVGYFTDEDGVVHGFLRQKDGEYETIDFPGAASTSVSQITDAGTMVGLYEDVAGDPLTSHGFILKDGESTAFDLPGAIATSLGGINDAEQMSGTYVDQTGGIHGFFLDGDQVTDIDPPDANVTLVSKMNEEAQVVGFFSDVDVTLPLTTVSGFVWDQGEYTRLDVPDGAPGSTVALGINSAERVVGGYLSQDQRSLGFLRDADGTYTTIDFPEAEFGVGPFDINDRHQIAGIYATYVDEDAPQP